MAEKSALIVDDSATARIMLAKVLNSMDVATKHAKSGEEALALLKMDHPDIIFLDHLMPGMDGFQTLRALKHNPDTQQIPVVMYTSQNALKYREEAKALGAAGVITKQLDREQLYLLVEKIWMQHEIGHVAHPIEQLDEANALPAAVNHGGHANVVELRPSQHTAASGDVEQGQGDRDELRIYVDRELNKLRERQSRDSSRYKNLVILLLAAFSLYALFNLRAQNDQISRLESQIEANRNVMQEMVDILERAQ